MTTMSFLYFITKLNDIMDNNKFQMILLEWTMAMLDGINKVDWDEVAIHGSFNSFIAIDASQV